MQTYTTDYETADSAAAANALFTGVKTRSNTLGYDETIDPDDPESMLDADKLETILEWAQDSGRDTGHINSRRHIWRRLSESL